VERVWEGEYVPHVNGKTKPVEAILGMGEEGDKGE
jgi:hypothetical protein